MITSRFEDEQDLGAPAELREHFQGADPADGRRRAHLHAG